MTLFPKYLGVLCLFTVLYCTPSAAQLSRVTNEVRRADLAEIATVDQLVMMPMRDGVRLATRIYRPKGSAGDLPTIFWRTPYDFSQLKGSSLMFALGAVRRGYAFIVQNERGKFFSEGDWEILGRPRTDGYDALTWIESQSWSNGKVGTLGCSSSAEWQLGLAAMDHPAHAAAIPMAAAAGIGRVGGLYEQGTYFRGGTIQLLMPAWLYGNQNTQRPTFPRDITDDDLVRLSKYYDLVRNKPPVDWVEQFWTLPVASLFDEIEGPKGYFQDVVSLQPNDPFWYKGGLYHDNEDFGVPALWFNSWYDHTIVGNLKLYEHARDKGTSKLDRENQHMVITPTVHCGFYRMESPLIVGEREMPNAMVDMEALVFEWFDHWLKGNGKNFGKQKERVRYYAMGAGEYRTAKDWPPKSGSTQTLYLQSDGNANSIYGTGALSNTKPKQAEDGDSFIYDPANPVMTRGGGLCCMGEAAKPGAFDQRRIEARQDVLVYTSEPFEKPTEISGYVEAIIYVSSDARDTDFTVKLVDVLPDGTAYNLDDTILRARYREGYDREVFMQEDEVYELRFDPMATSNVFDAGHRLRIEISSSNFPHFDRNLNTGGNNFDEIEGVVARNTVHHSKRYPSRVLLPIVE